MVKQNTKHTPRTQIDKKHLSVKLELLSKNVAKKGMFFVSKNKHDSNTFSVIDVKTKKPFLDDILTYDLAHSVANMLNRTEINALKQKRENVLRYLKRYQREVEKHIVDMMFYTHTLDTTTDADRFFITQTRLELSKSRFEQLIAKIRSGLFHSC